MKEKTMIKAFFGAWGLYFLFCLAAMVGIVVVAIHFISKYW